MLCLRSRRADTTDRAEAPDTRGPHGRAETGAEHDKTELVEPANLVRSGKGRVRHVEVFPRASVRTSIVRRPRRLSTLGPRIDRYTVICEVPHYTIICSEPLVSHHVILLVIQLTHRPSRQKHRSRPARFDPGYSTLGHAFVPIERNAMGITYSDRARKRGLASIASFAIVVGIASPAVAGYRATSFTNEKDGYKSSSWKDNDSTDITKVTFTSCTRDFTARIRRDLPALDSTWGEEKIQCTEKVDAVRSDSKAVKDDYHFDIGGMGIQSCTSGYCNARRSSASGIKIYW